jgi:hypothetical protein
MGQVWIGSNKYLKEYLSDTRPNWSSLASWFAPTPHLELVYFFVAKGLWISIAVSNIHHVCLEKFGTGKLL